MQLSWQAQVSRIKAQCDPRGEQALDMLLLVAAVQPSYSAAYHQS